MGIALSFGCALALAACGGGTDGPGKPPPGVAGAPAPREASAARTTASTPQPAATARPSTVGKRWPRTLQIGITDQERGASALRTTAPFGARWHYLSGGAGTPSSWDRWGTGNGAYVTDYASDSHASGAIPFFSFYVLQETPPASAATTEPQKVVRGLGSASVMRRVAADLQLAMQRLAAADDGPSVLQVEPDMWGYLQQRYGDDASKVPVRVRSAGVDGKGLPNTLAGFVRMVTRMRDRVAPSVLLAYPVSIFGTSKDIKLSAPSTAELDRMAARSLRFWRTAGRPFDLMTFEYANRDAGYQVKVDRVPAADAEWTSADFGRHLTYVRDVLKGSKRPGVLWQVPPGNTISPEMDDTAGHYSDNKVQTLLGAKGRPLLRAYRNAGVALVLFGSAFPNDTCACVRRDEAARGNGPDDGGYLADQVKRYVADGPLTLRRVPRRVR